MKNHKIDTITLNNFRIFYKEEVFKIEGKSSFYFALKTFISALTFSIIILLA